MQNSKYLDRFSALPASASDSFMLIGDYLLVERIDLEERRTSSGLIVSHGSTKSIHHSTEADLPVFVYILAVGNGFYDESTDKTVDNTVSVGDICLVGRNSVRWFSDLEVKDYMPYEVGLTREAEIHLVFKGKEGYQKVIDCLNIGTEAKVQP